MNPVKPARGNTSKLTSWLGRVLLPQDCLLCGAPSGEEPVCPGCRADLPQPPGETCPRCALPSPGGQACGSCLANTPSFDRTVAVWRYAPPTDRLIHSYKYGARLALAPYFARALATRLDAFPAVDAVVPVPLARGRLAERGFNQALEIARSLSPLVRVPVAARGLRRIRETADQTGLTPDARRKNVRGAFAVNADVAACRIAVVDDVMTTGASLAEIAGALKRAGATHVENWVVARTIPDA